MANFRTAFSAALLSAFWLLPVSAHAGDVTVDYSQLGRAQDNYSDNYMPRTNIVTEDLAPKQPIHLHPLTAAITSPTVKNLADVAPKSEIHLHPPAPKFVAAAPPPQNPTPPMAQSIAAPVTSIDLALAAVPVAPPKPDVAAAVPAETAPVPEPSTPKTEIAAVPEPEPVAPTPQDKMAVTEPIVPPPAPQKPVDDAAPGFIPVRDVVSKTDDLTPEDVVGLDLGPPQKTTDN